MCVEQSANQTKKKRSFFILANMTLRMSVFLYCLFSLKKYVLAQHLLVQTCQMRGFDTVLSAISLSTECLLILVCWSDKHYVKMAP